MCKHGRSFATYKLSYCIAILLKTCFCSNKHLHIVTNHTSANSKPSKWDAYASCKECHNIDEE